MDPDVSVIIPTYNHGSFVREAIESVLAQETRARVEVIVVDDGSTDDTPQVLSEVDDPRVRKFRTPNRGIGPARNEGLSHANGQFVGFLDSDDRWLPGRLERQLVLLRSEPEVGFVFSNFRRFDEEGLFPQMHFDFLPSLQETATRPSGAGEGRVILGDAFIELLKLEIFPTWLQTVLVRSHLVEDLRFSDVLGRAEDVEFMTRLSARTKAAYISEPLAELRRHGNNTTREHAATERAYVTALLAVKPDPRLTQEQRRALDRKIGRAWARVGYLAFHRKKVLQSACFYGQALRYPGIRWNAAKHLLALPLVPVLARKEEVEWT